MIWEAGFGHHKDCGCDDCYLKEHAAYAYCNKGGDCCEMCLEDIAGDQYDATRI